MAILKRMSRGNYTNTDANQKVIRYITRTREREDRKDELVAWGGIGVAVYGTPEEVIRQFTYVQDNLYNMKSKKNRRIFHEVYDLSEEDFANLGYDYSRVYGLAMTHANYYYSQGFQVVFAIHHAKTTESFNKGVHIHYVVNSVNYMTGKLWHESFFEADKRKMSFDETMQGLCGIDVLEFYD